MASNIDKFMKQAAQMVLKDLKKEIDVIVYRQPRALNVMKEDIIGEFLYKILDPAFTELNSIFGRTKIGFIDPNNVFVKINLNRSKSLRLNIDEEFLLHVYSENKEDDKKIRLGFFGGDAEGLDGEPLIISPINFITENDTALAVGQKLQSIFTDTLNKKAAKYAKTLEINAGDNS